MDKADFIHKRKGRYVAQSLAHFEEHIEPKLPPEAEGAAQDFKDVLRERFKALAIDSVDIISTDVNGVGQEVRDRLSPVGRP